MHHGKGAEANGTLLCYIWDRGEIEGAAWLSGQDPRTRGPTKTCLEVDELNAPLANESFVKSEIESSRC
jgi:hypothetical protein